jgi:hypothetical protein
MGEILKNDISSLYCQPLGCLTDFCQSRLHIVLALICDDA